MPKTKPRTPIISLLTDFGVDDPYVGVMKGVILSICPAARIVDICHNLSPFGIPEAGFTLAQAWRFFPKGTIHVVVVDPGVGSERRPILLEAMGHFFVGPDNGVFSMIYREASQAGGKRPYRVREITNPKLFLPQVSATFHGRDIFSPVSAHLASGKRPSAVGQRIENALRQDWDLPVRTGKRFWNATVLKTDRFGNLITNLRAQDFPLESDRFELQAGAERISKAVSCYADLAFGDLALLVGSSGYWEIAMNQASAAKRLGLCAGSPVELVLLG